LIEKLIDWLVFNTNFSSISAISWHEQIVWHLGASCLESGRTINSNKSQPLFCDKDCSVIITEGSVN
jgi:hypothetical protein